MRSCCRPTHGLPPDGRCYACAGDHTCPDGCDPPSGYRDVQLCAKLVCNEETALEERLPRACDGLVVEIQLHLKAIYDIKSDEGHAAYVRARNLLGESDGVSGMAGV